MSNHSRCELANILLQIIKTGIFVILLLPLFVDQNFLFPFVFPRTILFRLIIELCLVCYLVLIIIVPSYRPRWSPLLGLLVIFIAAMIISSSVGVNWYQSFWSSIERSEGIVTWLHFLIFFIILSSIFQTQKNWLQLFKMVILSGWLQCLYAFSQFLNFSFTLKIGGERISGSIGNPSFLAAYLIFIIFIAAYLYIQTTSLKSKLLYAALIFLDLFLLWQTETRGAILALLFGILFFISFKLWHSPKPKAKIFLFGFFFFLFILTSLFIINRNAQWVQSIGTLNRLAAISSADITTQNRLIVWEAGWRGFLERPWLGWGWENFNVVFNKYFNPLLSRDVGSQPWYDRAHNTIIEIATAAGFFGLLIYLAIFGWVFKLLWQKEKKIQSISTANLLLFVLLIVYFLQNLFVFDTLNSYLMFFLVLAFIQSQQFLSTKKMKKSPLRVSWQKNKFAFIAVFAVGLTTAVSLVYFLNIRPLLANYYVVQAVTKNKTRPLKMLQDFQKAFSYSPPAQQELRFVLVQYARDQTNLRGLTSETIPLTQFALKEISKSIQASPYSIQNYLLLAELYLTASPLDPNYLHSAETIALKALKQAPRRYQVYTLLGRLKMSQGQFSEGINYFQQAIKLNERFAEAHWNLAIAYILSQQSELAQQSLDKALEFGFNVYTPENVRKLLLAYQDSKDLKAAIDFLEKLSEQFPQEKNYQIMLASLKELYQQISEKTP